MSLIPPPKHARPIERPTFNLELLMLSHWQQADFDMLVLPIPSHTMYLSSEMLKFILQILMISHWQQRVFDVPKLLVPPFEHARSIEIPTFVLCILMLSHR